MATQQQMLDAVHSNAHLTMAEIRDALPPDLDIDGLTREAHELDKRFFADRTRAEIICILLAMLMANLLPD